MNPPTYLKRRMSGASYTMSSEAFHANMNYPDSVINAVLMVKSRPSRDRVLESIQTFLDKFGTMSSIPEDERWRVVENPLAENHLQETSLPSEASCFEFLEKLKTDPIPMKESRPWWYVHVLYNDSPLACQSNVFSPPASSAELKEQEDSRQSQGLPRYERHCIVFRIHHCIGDGVSLMEALGSVTSDLSDNPFPTGQRIFPRPPAPPTSFKTKMQTGAAMARHVGTVLGWASGRFDSALPLVGREGEREGGRVSYNGDRVTVAFPAANLQTIKAIKNCVPDASVNDVLLAAWTGVMRRAALASAGLDLTHPADRRCSMNPASELSFPSFDAQTAYSSYTAGVKARHDYDKSLNSCVSCCKRKGSVSDHEELSAEEFVLATHAEHHTSSSSEEKAESGSSTRCPPWLAFDYPSSAGVAFPKSACTASTAATGRGSKNSLPAFTSGSSVQTRVLMPVAFPRTEEELSVKDTNLGNRWAFASAALPVNVAHPVHRLAACRDTVQEMKSNGLFIAAMALTNLAANPPLNCMRSLLDAKDTAMQVMARHSVVFSNVPGPLSEEVRCLGAHLDEFLMIYPNAIAQTGILSYAGRVSFALCLDPAALPFPSLPLEQRVSALKSYWVAELTAMAVHAGCDLSKDGAGVLFYDA